MCYKLPKLPTLCYKSWFTTWLSCITACQLNENHIKVCVYIYIHILVLHKHDVH